MPPRQRPAAAPEREVIRAALGLSGSASTDGDIIRRNRRRRRHIDADEVEPPAAVSADEACAEMSALAATISATVPAATQLADPEDPPGVPIADPPPSKSRPGGAGVAEQRAAQSTSDDYPQRPGEREEFGELYSDSAAEPAEFHPEAVSPAQPAPRAKGRKQSGGILLQTRGLVKVYDGRAVVDGVDINVRQQEIVGLLGPNGAGKTTSFYMIVGLIQPNGGRVEFNGADATRQPMYKRARLGMGYLPQEESIFRKLTVKENIMAVLETQRYSAKERRERCHDLMKRFGIEKLANNVAITLSGGEKRRLTIARSLVTNPKLLMLDEPFSGVDPIAVGEIQDIICGLREQGLAILITDHNVRETLGIVDRAYLIYEGKVLMEGSRDELVNNPEARKLYLGQSFSM